VGGSSAGMTAEEIEYAKMMGKDPGAQKSSGFPPPIEVAKASWAHLSDPFYDKGPNDKGIGIQLAHSLAGWAWVSCWRWRWRCRWAS
jgi:nitrate/nitrite transport system permease protein